MNYLKIALNAFYKPDEVYNETKEESLLESFKFFIVLAAISIFFTFLNYLIRTKMGFWAPLAISLLSFGLGIIIIFAIAGIFHLFVKLFGGKKSFTETFKAFAYVEGFSVVTSLILLLFPSFIATLLNAVILLWGLVIFIMLFEKYTELGLGKGIGAFILGIITTMILGFLVVFVILAGTTLVILKGSLMRLV